MAKRNPVKDFLESSPWALGAVSFAAVASFILSGAEQGWKIYDRMREQSELPTVEVADLRGFLLIVPPKSMQEIPAIRAAIEGAKSIAVAIPQAPPPSGRVAVWPVQLLILNPIGDPLNVHSCRMSITIPGVKWSQSQEYFVSDTPILEARQAGQPIRVERKEAKRVQLMFVFSALEQMAVPDLPKSPKLDWEFLHNKSVAEISCRDQARRELRTTSTMWGSILPETDSEGTKIVYRKLGAWGTGKESSKKENSKSP